MAKIITALKSTGTQLIIVSVIIGAVNAYVPLADPKLASVVSLVLAILGSIKHSIETHQALMSPPPTEQ